MLETYSDLAVMFVQTSLVAVLTVWIAIGAYDNIKFSSVNAPTVYEVLQLKRMQTDYPEHFELLKSRAIESTRLRATVFWTVAAYETLTASLLTIAVIWMVFGAFGLANYEAAKVLAIVGVGLFTIIWGAFLSLGNWFAYWLCHDAAQFTHFHLFHMGVGVLVLLIIA